MINILPVALAGTILFVVLLCFIMMSFGIQVKRKTAYREAFVQQEAARERAVLQARLEEQERIMNLIARELHDNLGPLASLMYINLDQLDADTEEERSMTMQQLRRLTDRMAFDVQNVSHLLNTDYIKGQGLPESLQQELDYINTVKRIRCHFIIQGNVVSLAPDKELILFRLAQEAINNTIKHAKAGMLCVNLSYEDTLLTLVIEDDGCGFDMDTVHGLKGAGLLNMANRAQLLNGTLDIRSSPGAGCRIVLDLPL